MIIRTPYNDVRLYVNLPTKDSVYSRCSVSAGYFGCDDYNLY